MGQPETPAIKQQAALLRILVLTHLREAISQALQQAAGTTQPALQKDLLL